MTEELDEENDIIFVLIEVNDEEDLEWFFRRIKAEDVEFVLAPGLAEFSESIELDKSEAPPEKDCRWDFMNERIERNQSVSKRKTDKELKYV